MHGTSRRQEPRALRFSGACTSRTATACSCREGQPAWAPFVIAGGERGAKRFEKPIAESWKRWPAIAASGLRSSRLTQQGGARWLSCELYEQLGLDQFWTHRALGIIDALLDKCLSAGRLLGGFNSSEGRSNRNLYQIFPFVWRSLAETASTLVSGCLPLGS